MTISKNCEECGLTFSGPPSRMKSARFCGKGCYDASQSTAERRTLTCVRCDDKFTAKQDHGVWPKFCSRACFRLGAPQPREKTCPQCDAVFVAGRASHETEDGLRVFCSAACAHAARRTLTERGCLSCGRMFLPKNDGQATCSKDCATAYYAGPRCGNFKRGHYTPTRLQEKHILLPRPGYVGKYVGEHRVIAARAIGRPLERGEVVLRVNQQPDDNRVENLFICSSNSEFSRRRQGSLPWPTKSNLDTYEIAPANTQPHRAESSSSDKSMREQSVASPHEC